MVEKYLICGGGIEKTMSVKEKMYAIGGNFRYGQCSNCKCLQCSTPPENMGDYYPSGYYSFDSSFKKLAGGNFLEEDLSEKLSCGIQGFLIRQFIYDFRIIKFFGIIVV